MAPVEELVLRVQGFLLEANLPPLRRNQIPGNANRLIDLKQSITVGGLGSELFDDAVSGMITIYEHFKTQLRGYNLRPWRPEQRENHLALTFSNRYLTQAKFAQGETVVDLSLDVDPFNVLRPRLTSQVHLQENVVEYWEHSMTGTDGSISVGCYQRVRPDVIVPGTMVEVQVAFAAVKLGRDDYIFLPKLRAICVLDRGVQSDYNVSRLKELCTKSVSPLKKVKRKIGYGDEGRTIMEDSNQRMKRMSLREEQEIDYSDVDLSK
ncbi:hypothetical protein OH77DRAFT_1499631 [Trametes cingulata]|nr:hypothetical protein OH77DRAFT_1499631 [Trametes cingulata]